MNELGIFRLYRQKWTSNEESHKYDVWSAYSIDELHCVLVVWNRVVWMASIDFSKENQSVELWRCSTRKMEELFPSESRTCTQLYKHTTLPGDLKSYLMW